MDYRNFKKGDPLSKITAEQLNAFLGGASASRSGMAGMVAGKSDLGPNPLSILVRNASGADVDDFNILTLSEPAVVPPALSDPDRGFASRMVMDCIKPTDVVGRWCVLQGPIANGQFGRAVVIGLTWCWINLTATGDMYVEAVADSTIPKSGSSGAQIVWVKGLAGTATATGPQWAIIKIGGGGGAKGVYLSITGNNSAYANYNANLVQPTANVTGSTSFASAFSGGGGGIFGGGSGTGSVLALNADPADAGGHSVQSGAVFPATYHSTNSSGTPVYVFNGWGTISCDEIHDEDLDTGDGEQGGGE